VTRNELIRYLTDRYQATQHYPGRVDLSRYVRENLPHMVRSKYWRERQEAGQ